MVRSLIYWRTISLLLIAALLALTPAAYASPPDQTWISGLYDDADYDDVVLFITSGLGGIQPTLVWAPRVVAPVIGLVPPADTPVPALPPVAFSLSRAPPLA